MSLQKENNTEELQKRLSNRIEFGTAGKKHTPLFQYHFLKYTFYLGLRARMEAGFSRMNDLTVLQASQGLAAYIEQHVEDAKARGIVIGHDHRHHSDDFARLTAFAFLQRGFKVWYYKHLVHTPLVVKFIIQKLLPSNSFLFL